MSPFLIIFVSLIVADAAWWRWGDARLRRTRRAVLWRTLLGLWCGLMIGYMLYFLLFPHPARRSHAWMPVWALSTIYLWHILVLPVTAVMIGVGGLVNAIRKFARRNVTPSDFPSPPMAAGGLSRREALIAGAVAIPPLVTGSAVGRSLWQLGQFRVRELVVPIVDLPWALDGLRIAHVSDLHIGRFTRGSTIPAVADAVNSLQADLVFFTGDLIDLSINELPRGIDFIRRLDPRSGLFMIEGNHDLIDDPFDFEMQVRDAGLPLLLDESRVIDVRGTPVQILGLTWRRGDAGIVGAMSQIIPQRRPDAFQVLLAHHPHAFDPAAAVGVPLVLSGHTHGGQLMLNEKLGAGPVLFRYWSGLYQNSASSLVVSNGVGNWFPMRINAPAEIGHLTLRRENS